MERPPPDPAKLLEAWMEWERGDLPPGRVISNLKTGGMRDLLEALIAAAPAEGAVVAVTSPEPVEAEGASAGSGASTESWTPVV